MNNLKNGNVLFWVMYVCMFFFFLNWSTHLFVKKMYCIKKLWGRDTVFRDCVCVRARVSVRVCVCLHKFMFKKVVEMFK